MKKTVIFDIETNGFLGIADTVWLICTHQLETGEAMTFSDIDPNSDGSIEDGLKYLRQSDTLIAHNGIGFDFPVLKDLLGFKVAPWIKIVDTMLLSQLSDQPLKGGHSLGAWGKRLGHKKPEHEEWLKWSPDMSIRCQEDVAITVKLYQVLYEHCVSLIGENEKFKDAIRVEHEIALFTAAQVENGWLFDINKAHELIHTWTKRINIINDEVAPHIKSRIIRGDVRGPKYLKDGMYDKNTARYFGISQKCALTTKPIWGQYTKFSIVETDIGNLDALKDFLFTQGWIPDTFNYEKDSKGFPIKDDTGNLIIKSYSLSETSMESIDGELGKLVVEYNALRHRRSQVEGWIKALRKDTRLVCQAFTMGTPTFRMRHKGIVNVPGPYARYGEELRRLFIVPDGYKVVGCDSAGNQFRLMAHYMGDPDMTKSVLEGDSKLGTDVHTRNAEILGISRALAKNFIYGFLFGAGATKIGQIITGAPNLKAGKVAKAKFLAGMPKLGELLTRVDNTFKSTKNKTGKGFLPGLDGRRVYVDSAHKAFNYLLQSGEAITCKAAVAMAWDKIQSEGLDARPLLMMHDEVQLEVREDHVERVSVILEEAFRDAPKQYGVEIMDGDSAVGKDWFETH